MAYTGPVWVTRYWLTCGIWRYDRLNDTGETMAGEGATWHRSEAAAQAGVKDLASARLLSLDKQRANVAAILVDGVPVTDSTL